MTVEQMNRSTLSEILIRSMGITRQREHSLKETRLLMWEIRTKYLKKGKRIKPTDIFLIGDEKPEIKVLSKEEYKQLNQMWGN